MVFFEQMQKESAEWEAQQRAKLALLQKQEQRIRIALALLAVGYLAWILL